MRINYRRGALARAVRSAGSTVMGWETRVTAVTILGNVDYKSESSNCETLGTIPTHHIKALILS